MNEFEIGGNKVDREAFREGYIRGYFNGCSAEAKATEDGRQLCRECAVAAADNYINGVERPFEEQIKAAIAGR